MWKFRKYSKKLAEYYQQQNNLEDVYMHLTSDAGCIRCKYYNQPITSSYSQKFIYCSECDKTEKIREISRKLDEIDNEIDMFIENEYANVVFNYYNNKKPSLIENSSGNNITWNEAFGSDFSKISKSLRHSLVGLIEKTGRYTFK